MRCRLSGLTPRLRSSGLFSNAFWFLWLLACFGLPRHRQSKPAKQIAKFNQEMKANENDDTDSNCVKYELHELQQGIHGGSDRQL